MSRTKSKLRVAELNIMLVTEHEKTLRQAEDYRVEGTQLDFDKEQVMIELPEDFLETKRNRELPETTLDDMEYICTGSLFYRNLLRYHGMMLHSSAVVVDGFAYLFSADSGTGKSTHTRLWKEHFGDRAFIINDDKPALRKIDGKWYVYGTPWSGKTNQNVNAKVELGAIVLLERSADNWIRELSPEEAMSSVFAQTTRRLFHAGNMDLLLTTLDELLKEVPLYQMGCNISDEAVVMAYEKIERK